VKYPRVGKCIYCGSTEDLSDEHIIPEGLHGDWVLPDASCEPCRIETGKFEQRVLRGPLWPPRVELGLKTKRPKQRPKAFPLTVARKGIRTRENIPVGKNLPSVLLPVFGKPGFLDPATPIDSLAVSGMYVGHIDRTPDHVKETLGADGVWLETAYPVVDFARMVAKIGYAYAVAQVGIQNVINPLVVSGILGRGTDLGQWIGSAPEALPGPDATALHAARLHRKGDFLAVTLQLFTLQPTPVYLILVSKG
jgi:hypothetical protein